MMKGVSVWLFSKIVMMVFLVSVFSVMAGIILIVSERALADSAESLTQQVKDSIQGVVSTGSLSSQKIIPIPNRLPENTDSGREYIMEVGNRNHNNNYFIYTAISWDISNPNPSSFAASSLLYYPTFISIKGGSETSRLGNPPSSFQFNSSEYRYLVIIKETQGSSVNVCIKACNSTTASGDFKGCSVRVC